MHLKRLNTPKRWNISKKKTTFIARTSPGPYSKEMSLPLIVILREHLKLINSKKEAKGLLNNKSILVNNKAITDLNQAIGLFDTISIPVSNNFYRLVLDYKGGLIVIPIDEKEAKIKLLRVDNKKRLKKGVMQFNLTGGRNLLSKDSFCIGDTLLFDLDKNKVLKKLPIKIGSKVLVIKGRHAGETPMLLGFKEFENITKDRAILKNKDSTYQTMKDYIFVLGEGKEEIKISE
ncbi:MAG: 30S ribosomal protein S4e [Candidatus Nanoarchaeia archaeon]|jgi:small subunit ribosomal protein S4e